MNSPDQHEIEKFVKDSQEYYEKSGPLMRFILTLKAVWIKLNLAFPIFIPVLIGAIITGIIMIILDQFDPNPLKHGFNSWEMVILFFIVFPLIIWPLSEKNLAFVEFVKNQMDDKNLGK